MTTPNYASAESSATALNMLALAGYATPALARAENVAFVCAECGTLMEVTPDATSSFEDQQRSLAQFFVLSCCGEENLYIV